MPSVEPNLSLNAHARRVLLEVARDSIEHGERRGGPARVDLTQHSEALREPGASFVTLRSEGALRGCIGRLEPRRPLVLDVSESAFKAAFRDPRFSAVQRWEIPGLEIQVSVLGPLEPLQADSERELLSQLRPGIDGLRIRQGAQEATFLPAVWEQLPEPARFLRELLRKARMPDDTWPSGMEVSRYRAESFLLPARERAAVR